MKIWLNLPFLPIAQLRELVQVVDELGIDGVAVSEHVCVPTKITSEYPYLPGKPAHLPVETEFPEPFTLIAALGAVTKRLRFMTNVLILPLRHPVLLAKEVATTAVLLDGRLDLGVGVGWMREEFDALDVPFESRGARTDESLRLLRRLWTGEEVDGAGEHFSFASLAVRPIPPTPVPVLIGGQSRAALRRAARLGDGWIGVNPTFEELQSHIAKLNEERERTDTRDSMFEIRTGLKGTLDADRLSALQDLGVTSLMIMPWQVTPGGAARGSSIGSLERRLSTLVTRLRAAS